MKTEITRVLGAESVEQTIRRLVEKIGFKFTAYYECIGQKLLCTIDDNWEIGGVIVTESELSFVALKNDQKPVKFCVRGKFAKLAAEWFEKTANTLVVNREIIAETRMPDTIVFSAGTTEFLPTAKAVPA